MSCLSVPDSGDRPLSFLAGEEVTFVSSYADCLRRGSGRDRDPRRWRAVVVVGGGGEPSVSNTTRHHQYSVLLLKWAAVRAISMFH